MEASRLKQMMPPLIQLQREDSLDKDTFVFIFPMFFFFPHINVLSCSPELQMAALKFASVSACSIDNLCPGNEGRTLAAASKSWQEVAFSSGSEGKLHSLLLL